MPKEKDTSEAKIKLQNRFPQLGCSSPQFNGCNFTNRVIYQQKQGSKNSSSKRIYYCPAYLSLQNRNFENMNFEDLVAAINTILILTINLRGISPVLQRKIRSLLTLSFNRDDSIRVKQNSKEIRVKTIKSGLYAYKIHKLIHIAMKPYIVVSPLQKIDLIMSVCLKRIQMNTKFIYEICKQIQQRQQKLGQQLSVLRKQFNENLKLEQKNKIQYSIKLKNEQNQCLNNEYISLSKLGSIQVNFNFMDSTLTQLKVSYTAEGSFSTYDVCQQQMNAEYTNNEVPKDIQKNYDESVKKLKGIQKLKNKEEPTSNTLKIDHSLIKPFNYAHFTIPLHKKPYVTIITIFLPLWLLSIIMLGIYFQNSQLNKRLNNLSVLLIAYINLVGLIRGQLPQSPKVTLIEVLVYLQISCGLLLFGQSLYLQGIPDYKMVWTQNVPYIISVTILALQVFIVMILMLIYVFQRRPKFVRKIKKRQKFNYLKWQNAQCDKDFRRKIDNGLVKVSQVDEKKQNIKEYINEFKQNTKKKQDSQQNKSKNLGGLGLLQALSKPISQIEK